MSDCVSHGAMWLESRVRVFAPRRPFAMAEEMPAVAMADAMPAVAPQVADAAKNAEKEKKEQARTTSGEKAAVAAAKAGEDEEAMAKPKAVKKEHHKEAGDTEKEGQTNFGWGHIEAAGRRCGQRVVLRG